MSVQPQRGCATQPRVAPQALPWEQGPKGINPGGVAQASAYPWVFLVVNSRISTKCAFATPLGLVYLYMTIPG